MSTKKSPKQKTGRTAVKAYGVKNENEDINPISITRRPLFPNDIQIDLKFCGICHTDIHHVYNEWKDSIYPMVPGHEMVGLVSHVGSAVKEFKVSDRVAVGNLVNSCRKCEACKQSREQYCSNGGVSYVYNGTDRYPGELLPSGERTYGGYSKMIVVDKDFVIRLPDKLKFEEATPLLCAGITVFSAIQQNEVKGKTVAIAGIGGLGHLAIKFAKALGATVIAFTTTEWKIKDAKRLGADDVVFSPDQHDMKRYVGKINLIIDTIPQPHKYDPYLDLLKMDGTLWVLGTMENVPDFNAKRIIAKNTKIAGSNVGGIKETWEMLNFCAKHNIVSDVEIAKAKDIQDCFDKIRENKVKYRYVIDLSTI